MMEMNNSGWIEECSRRLMIGFHMPDDDQLPEYAGLRDAGAAPLLSRFNPRKFIHALRDARVQAFWFYNKCHQGNCYYPSRVPGAHVHSALRGRDLFGEICAECDSADIVPLCIYEFFDYRVMSDHPDWCCRLSGARQSSEFLGEEHKRPAQDLKVGRPCLHGPYAEFAIAQAVETVKNYPVRAYYVDFLGVLNFDNWICPFCNAAFRKDFGFDFKGIKNLSHAQYVEYVEWHYMQHDILAQKYLRALRDARPDIIFVHNAHVFGSTPNMQRWDMAARNCDFLTCDLFAKSGTLYLSWMPRAFRAAGRRRPEVLLDTTHGGDRRNPKAMDGFLAETWTARAIGAAACTSICFRPDGSWNRACMALARRAFEEQAACEPWLRDMKPISDIGLIHSQPSSDFTPRDHKPFTDMARHDLAFEGWAQVLIQEHCLWDVLHDFQMDAEHLDRFKTIILPDAACIHDKAAAALRAFVRRGGNLVFTGDSASRDEKACLRRGPALDAAAGIARRFRPKPGYREMLLSRPPLKPSNPWEADVLKFNIPPRLIGVSAKTDVWAHLLTPLSGDLSRYAGCIARRFGRGRIICWAGDPGLEYRAGGTDVCRRAMGSMLRKLACPATPVRVSAPGTVEVLAHYQPAQKRLVVNLVNSVPGISRSSSLLRTIHDQTPVTPDTYRKIEEVGIMPPVSGVLVTFRSTARKRIRRVYRVPDGKALRRDAGAGAYTVRVPEFTVHTMIAAE